MVLNKSHCLDSPPVGGQLDLSPELQITAARIAGERMQTNLREIATRTDRLFCGIMFIQFLAAVAVAGLVTPHTWIGATADIHLHVWTAVLVGGALSLLVSGLTSSDPGRGSNAYVIAIAQMIMSVLLIHLTGGRLETHFHIFGSLAVLTQYRRASVLLLATAVAASDHCVRGYYWPQSVFGLDRVESWRWLEHTGWILLEDAVLIVAIYQKKQEMRHHAHRWALLSINKQVVEAEVLRQTRELDANRRRLQVSEARLRNVIDTAYDAYLCLDERLRIIQWSQRAEQMLGWESALVLGQPCNAILQTVELAQAIEAALAGQRKADDRGLYLVETATMTAAGQRLAVEASWNLAEAEREIVVNVFLRDITERKQRSLLQMHSQKMESIGLLAAGIAHEINTPSQFVGDNLCFLDRSFQQVDALLGHIRDVLDAAQPPDATAVEHLRGRLCSPGFQRIAAEIPKALDQSREGMQRISSITRAMKDFSHPGSERMTFVDLHAAIANTLVVCRNEWKYVAEVQTEFDSELPSVECFPCELNQVILNLVVNAAHAIADAAGQPERRPGRIIVRTRVDGDFAEIDVEDNGAGIPETIRQKIFDPFFTTKAVGKGTGQGLPIAHSVMEKHHGSIRFATAPGVGTTFTLRLPLTQNAYLDKEPDDANQDAHSLRR